MPDQQAPPRIDPKSLGDYLEVMSKTVFQSGISWKVVESKWPGIRGAFHGFEIARVADLTPPDLDAMAQDTRVIRNRRKLGAIVDNARRIVELDESHGTFGDYLKSHSSFEERVKDMRKKFKFLGDMGCYYFLYVVGEDVPPHEEWMASRR